MGERATRSVVIDVPAGEWLTSNGRYHWASRARRTRALRVRAAIAANAYPAVKACIDGLVDAGILPDDPDPHLPTGHHRLTVNITDTTGDKGRP